MASDEKFTRTTSVNLIAWATPYFTAVSMFSHPIACRYHKSKAQAFAVTFLLTLVLAQYIATWIWNTRTANGVLQQDRSYNFAPKYRCLESKIAQAPGETTCSAQQLCSLNYLFKAENYITNRPELALPLNLSSSLESYIPLWDRSSLWRLCLPRWLWLTGQRRGKNYHIVELVSYTLVFFSSRALSPYRHSCEAERSSNVLTITRRGTYSAKRSCVRSELYSRACYHERLAILHGYWR